MIHLDIDFLEYIREYIRERDVEKSDDIEIHFQNLVILYRKPI